GITHARLRDRPAYRPGRRHGQGNRCGTLRRRHSRLEDAGCRRDRNQHERPPPHRRSRQARCRPRAARPPGHDPRPCTGTGAFADGAVKIDATYTTPYQNHNPMEPHASVAEWSGDRLTIHCAVQLVDSAHHSIATTLKVPLEQVEVISEFVGGGFGGKLPVYADAILAALAARELSRPVKVVLT